MLETLRSDLTFAARMLRKSPVFTIIAVLCISLGSGAVTTIFSAMNGLVLRPLPGATNPEQLVRMERTRSDGKDGYTSASYPYYQFLRERVHSFSGLAVWGKVPLTLSVGGEGTSVYGNLVSGNHFAVLGVQPLAGRFFTPDEDQVELRNPVIVISEAFWRSHLGSDPNAIGRAMSVNGNPYTLVGVAPAQFRGLDAPVQTDAWVPLAMVAQLRHGHRLNDAMDGWLRLCGRLRDGVTPDVARRELIALTASRGTAADEPSWNKAYDNYKLSALTGLPSDATDALIGFLGLLFGASGLVLLIASVNVASMLSARAIARRPEMAVRAALGAGRGRLVRQLLTEILLLFVVGAVGGIVLAQTATSALEQLTIPNLGGAISFAIELSPDPRVFVFALLTSLITGLAFGLAPALRASRADINARLRGDSARSGARRTVWSNMLIVGQLALSMVLLVAAGLFLRALDRGQRIDPGFDASRVAVTSLNTESWGYDEAKGRTFFRELRDQVAAIPGVTAVTYAGNLPLTFHSSGDRIEVGGGVAAGADSTGGVFIRLFNVDPDYFSVVRIPILQGVAFTARDDEHAPRVAVINATMARLLWPDGSALGRSFMFRKERVTIVGIARDAKYSSLTESTPPFIYFPIAQFWESTQVLMVRANTTTATLASAIQRLVTSIDPALPHAAVTQLKEENAIVLLPQRVAAIVTAALGAVGLLLASVGLYGIMAYTTSRRSREIGLRMALGAQRRDVLGMIVRDGMGLAGKGVLIGLVLAIGVTRLLASLLFGVSPMDVLTFAGMSVLFVSVALLASYLPARRAAASDPMVALRID